MGEDAWQIEAQGTLAINQTYIFLLHHRLAHHKVLAGKKFICCTNEGIWCSIAWLKLQLCYRSEGHLKK